VEVSKNRTGKILLHFVKVKGEVREKFVECKLHGTIAFSTLRCLNMTS
jgi:hypothetical protein